MVSETAAPTTEPAAGPGRGGLHWLAIVIGAGIDVAGTRVSSTMLSVAVGVALSAAGGADTNGAQTLVAGLVQSRWLSALGIAMGLLWSVAGGYLAGYLAKRRHLAHAVLAGVCAASFGLASQAISAAVTMTPWLLGLSATTLPAALLGGWLSSLGSRGGTQVPARRD